MENVYLYHSTFRQGEYGYNIRPYGCLEIHFDNKVYYYKKPDNLRAFKNWAVAVIPGRMNESYKIEGNYPTYFIRSKE